MKIKTLNNLYPNELKQQRLRIFIPLFLFIFIASFAVKSVHPLIHHTDDHHSVLVDEQVTEDSHPQCTIESFVFYYLFTWEPFEYHYFSDFVYSIFNDTEQVIPFVKVFNLYDLRAPPVYLSF